MHSVSSEDEENEEYVYLSQRTQPLRTTASKVNYGNTYPIIITKLQENSQKNTIQPNEQPIDEEEMEPAAEEDGEFEPDKPKKRARRSRSWLKTLAKYNLCPDDFCDSEDEARYREDPSHLYLLRRSKGSIAQRVPRV